jgi:hypothetical protein
LQQREEVARAVCHRGAREAEDRGIANRLASSLDQGPSLAAALAGVVLEVMGLVEDQAGPGLGGQHLGLRAKNVVVDDDPALRARTRGVAPRPDDARLLASEDIDARTRVNQPDLALPVEFDRGGADDQVRPGRGDIVKCCG